MRSFLKQHRKLLLKLGAILLALLIYPLFVLAYTWIHVYQSGFEGGKNGPLDAYRHTLASAVVSYTIGDWAVKLTTRLMESKTSVAGQMDRHNNLLGAEIGTKAKSFGEIEPTVHARVLKGTSFSTKPDQVTWLPKERWGKRMLW